MLIFTALKHLIKGRAKVSLRSCGAIPSQYKPYELLSLGQNTRGTVTSLFWMSHSVIVIYSKRTVTSTQAPSQPLSKANMHPVPTSLGTSEGCKVKCYWQLGLWWAAPVLLAHRSKTWRAGKDKISCYWSVEDHDCRDRLGLHTGALSIWCCATQQTQQPPWKHCACSTCSTLLRLDHREIYLVAPFKFQKHICILELRWWCQIHKETWLLAPLVLDHLNFQRPDV